jgi:hypothetical protein
VTQLWLRQPNCPERVRLAITLAQIERAADRYSVVGHVELTAALRALSRQGRFRSVSHLTEQYHELINHPAITNGKSSVPSSPPLGFAGWHESLRFCLTPDTIRVDGGTGWRHYNPCYLSYNPEGRELGAIGFADGLAIFPSDRAGRAAFNAYLRTDAAQSLTLQEICARASEHEYGLSALDAHSVGAAAGADPGVQLGELSEKGLNDLTTMLCDWALSWKGHEYTRSDGRMPDWVRAKFAAVPSQAAPRAPGVGDGHLPVPPDAPPPADVYIPSADLCVVAAFFNPCMSRTRTRNFEAFLRSLSESKVHWRCIECVFGDRGFELPPDPRIVQIRSQSIVWQKERLLNSLIGQLPDQFSKVAWIDADVVFSNPYWLPETSDALHDHAVIQPFEAAIRLPEQGFHGQVQAHEVAVSFAALFRKRPESVAGDNFWSHGHTGFAWAGRRDWLQAHGLYDAALSGTADHLMAHAFVGTWECPCVFERMKPGPRWAHFDSWCRSTYSAVRSSVSSIPGTVYSFWHGSVIARNHGYYRADHCLDELGFDPRRDVSVSASGALEWRSPKPSLHQWAIDYFRSRDEGQQADA